MSVVKKVERKAMIIRPSGRSSDYITPSFGYGCLLNCSYCYMKRHLPNGLTVAKNTETILTEINSHVYFTPTEKPNQTDPVYVTYDLSCNEDFALHAKYHEWEKIFEFFRDHPLAKATLATKIVPELFLKFNPMQKVRIRFSLMPQHLSDELEPNTAKIIDRIKAIDRFIDAGYDVHINYSPVIYTEDWEQEYTDLFKLVDEHVINKDVVQSEVIFLTHNKDKHAYNIDNNVKGEDLLWVPELQEPKTSEYGCKNIRYKRGFKSTLVEDFIHLHKKYVPWNTIRYIF